MIAAKNVSMDEFMRGDFGEPLPVSEALLKVSHKPLSWLFRQYDYRTSAIHDKRAIPTSYKGQPMMDFRAEANLPAGIDSSWRAINAFGLVSTAQALDVPRQRGIGESGLTIGEAVHLVSRFPRALRGSMTEDPGTNLFFPPTEIKRYYLMKMPYVNGDTITAEARNELQSIGDDAWLSYVVMTNRLPSIHTMMNAQGIIDLARRYAETGLDVVELSRYIAILGQHPATYSDPSVFKLASDNGLTIDMLTEVAAALPRD